MCFTPTHVLIDIPVSMPNNDCSLCQCQQRSQTWNSLVVMMVVYFQLRSPPSYFSKSVDLTSDVNKTHPISPIFLTDLDSILKIEKKRLMSSNWTAFRWQPECMLVVVCTPSVCNDQSEKIWGVRSSHWLENNAGGSRASRFSVDKWRVEISTKYVPYGKNEIVYTHTESTCFTGYVLLL